MSPAPQNLRRAASAEPPITHQNKPQIPKRAASAEPQSTNQSKRQKLQAQDKAQEQASLSLTPENNAASQRPQSPENGTDAEDSDEDSDVGEAEDLSGSPTKKGYKRSKRMKIVDKFSAHGNKTGIFSEELKNKGHDSHLIMLPNERKRLMKDLVKKTIASEPRDQPKVGLDFMSEFSTGVDSPKDAATFLGINLRSLRISSKSSLRLRIDQVQNIAFMVSKAEGTLKGYVNANDYSIGKTIEALASIFFLA